MRLAAPATVITRSIVRSTLRALFIISKENEGPKGATEQIEQPKLGKGVYVVAKLNPIGDRVVVKPTAKEEVTKSGIVIPDTAKEKPQEGTVIAVGSGRQLDNGDRAAMSVREGDRILFSRYGGTEFKLDSEEYLVLRESDILAILG